MARKKTQAEIEAMEAEILKLRNEKKKAEEKDGGKAVYRVTYEGLGYDFATKKEAEAEQARIKEVNEDAECSIRKVMLMTDPATGFEYYEFMEVKH